MPRTAPLSALLIGLVLLAGCAGNVSDTGVTHAPNTTDAESTSGEPNSVATAGGSEAIAVVNERSVPLGVRLYVLREPNPVLDITFANGSTLTQPVNDSSPVVQGLPFVYGGTADEPNRNVTSIRPTGSAAIAKWSAIVRPASAITFPRPIDRHNVTVLVVVETTSPEQPLVYTAGMNRCEPPHAELSEFRLTLRSHANRIGMNIGCG